MIKKRRIQIIVIIFVITCIYIMNHIAFFKDREFERAVRESLNSSHMVTLYKRDKALYGIVWKKDLEKVDFVSINFREYRVKNIEDIKYFKNTKTVWFSYASAYK
ncbi:hypothetical protein HMPREF0381_0829, partial [Lachnoanaerobaculum saburreum DSM 3986]